MLKTKLIRDKTESQENKQGKLKEFQHVKIDKKRRKGRKKVIGLTAKTLLSSAVDLLYK